MFLIGTFCCETGQASGLTTAGGFGPQFPNSFPVPSELAWARSSMCRFHLIASVPHDLVDLTEPSSR